MKSLVQKIFDWSVFIVAAIIVLLAVMLSLARLFLPHLTTYRPRIQEWASEVMHQPVRIGEMDADWRGLEPELKFRRVAILSKDDQRVLLEVNELGLGIDLLKSLFKWQVEPGWVVLSGANVTLHQDASGKITVNGIATPTGPNDTSQLQMRDIVNWLLNQNRIYLEHINLVWYGKDGKVIPVSHIKLRLTNNLLGSELLGAGIVEQPNPSHFQFVLKFNGNVFTDSNFKARLFLDARNVPLNFWLQNHLPNIDFVNGQARFQMWVDWTGQQLQQIQSRINVENFALKSSKYLQREIHIREFSGNLFWQQNKPGWSISGTTEPFNLDNIIFEKTVFDFTYTPLTPASPQILSLQTDSLNLEAVKRFTVNYLLLPSKYMNLIKQLNPRGKLHDFNITFTKTDAKNHTLTLTSQFENLYWQRWQKIPGVENLSGEVKIMPDSGSLSLDAQDTRWDFGNLFRSKIPINNLSGDVDWQKNTTGWEIRLNKFSAANELINVTGNLTYFVANNHSSPLINLLASYDIADPKKAMWYLPVGIMSKGLVSWLDGAIVSSDACSGNLVLSGPVNNFPFDHQEGRFVVNAQLKNMTLHYRDAWPDILGLNGEITFDNSAMAVEANTGKIFNAQLKKTQANIADLRKPILQVNGGATGDLSDALRFLQQSPLNDSIGKRLQGFVLTGPMDLNLQLNIPLFGKAATKVQGNLTTVKADLQLPQWWNLHVKDLQADLQFTEKTLGGNLQGILFDNPLNVKISTLNPNSKQPITQFDLGKGQMTLQQISQRFSLPQIKYVDGTLNYQALLQFADGNAPFNRLIVNSDLQSIKVNLPVPLGKTAKDAVPSQLQLQFGSSNKLQLLLNYGKRLSAALTYLHSPEGEFNLSAGELTFGGQTANFQSAPGLLIDGYIPIFNWSDWQPLLGDQDRKPGERKKSLLRKVDLNFGQFNGFGLSLPKTELQLEAQEEGWDVGINNSNMSGQLLIPYEFPNGVVVANFQRLYLTQATQGDKNKFSPKEIPDINFSCQDFHYGDKNFGQVQFALTHETTDIMSIDRLNVQGSGVNLNASGEWRATRNAQSTDLNGQLTSQNIGTFLQNWNITKSVVGGNGNANFSLHWSAAPYQLDLRTLSGSINLKFSDGRIINLSSTTETELGLGRVLNLFSLQTIPRRLRLDFSDLTDAGFSFDVMQGDFSLQDGNATTSNAYLDGPVAKVRMKGRIGLASEDYDLIMMVSPYVTSSLPIVATVAGGPIAGAVTWLASKILSPAVSEMITYTYQVTGSWNNPTVMKMSQARKMQLSKSQ